MTSRSLGGPCIQRHTLITATNTHSVRSGIRSHSWCREGECREHLHVCSERGYCPGLARKAWGLTLGHTAGRWHSWEMKAHQAVATTLSSTLTITWLKLLAAQSKETFQAIPWFVLNPRASLWQTWNLYLGCLIDRWGLFPCQTLSPFQVPSKTTRHLSAFTKSHGITEESTSFSAESFSPKQLLDAHPWLQRELQVPLVAKTGQCLSSSPKPPPDMTHRQ